MKNKKHTEGFDIPNNYFEEFESRLLNRINIELLPKDSGFSIPEGYFKGLDDKINHRVKKPINETKVISIVSRKTILYAASIAACATLIFTLAIKNTEEITINDVEFSSIKTYIEEGNIDIDNSDLSLLFTEEDLNQIVLEESYISEETMQEYLLENINDSSILIE